MSKNMDNYLKKIAVSNVSRARADEWGLAAKKRDEETLKRIMTAAKKHL